MRLAPRIKHNRNGTITVSGISWHDFNSLMTEASLAIYDLEVRHAKSGKPLDLDSEIWRQRLRTIIQMAGPPRYEPPYKDIPVSQLEPHQLHTRLVTVRQDRHDRKTIERIMDEILNHDDSENS